MLKKILAALGYKEAKYKWSDFEKSIQNKLLFKAFLTIPVTFVCISFATIMDTVGIIFSIFLIFAYCFTVIQFYLDFKYGNFDTIVGECVEYHKEMIGFKRLFNTYGKAWIVIKDASGLFYKFPASHHAYCKKGMLLAVYTRKNTLYRSDEDMVDVTGLLAYTVVSHANAFEQNNDK